MFYFATESGDHVIKILICDWSVINVLVVFVCWSCKFCLYFRLLKLFNLFCLFNMTWMDSEIESLITFYSSMLVSGARNFATGVKNRCQFSGAGFWNVCHGHYTFLLLTIRRSLSLSQRVKHALQKYTLNSYLLCRLKTKSN